MRASPVLLISGVLLSVTTRSAAVVVVLAGIWLGVTWRALTVSVIAVGDILVVRNVARTVRVAAADVARFERRYDLNVHGDVLSVVSVTGQCVPISAMIRWWPVDDSVLASKREIAYLHRWSQSKGLEFRVVRRRGDRIESIDLGEHSRG